jgi:hypothetical protein
MKSPKEHRNWIAKHISEAIYRARWCNNWLRWKAGRRGTFLGILATADIGYGISLALRFANVSGMPPSIDHIVPFSFRQWG